jgi:hypothetical protein
MADEDRSFARNSVLPDRAQQPGLGVGQRQPNAARDEEIGDLGLGTPAGVDVHDLGQEDNPQQAWGEPADEEALFSSNHTRRPYRTEVERGQGAKTRQRTKDIISRRS